MSGEQMRRPEPEQERPIHDEPRIYVASLADYNNGILHGAWLAANRDAAALQAGITAMLAASPTTRRYGDVAEEWAIHDYNGFTPHIRLGEFESLEQVATLARGIARHGEAFAAWWSLDEPPTSDDGELTESFESQYIGQFASVEEYARELLEDQGVDSDALPGLPEHLQPYIRLDVEDFARDLELSGDICSVESEDGVFVFWGYTS